MMAMFQNNKTELIFSNTDDNIEDNIPEKEMRLQYPQSSTVTSCKYVYEMGKNELSSYYLRNRLTGTMSDHR